MRNLLAVAFVVGAIGFLWMIGYAVRTVFEDFGMAAGLIASGSTVAGLVAFGCLLDMRDRPPPR